MTSTAWGLANGVYKHTLYLISWKGRNHTLQDTAKNLRAGSLMASVQIMTLTMPNTGPAISSILRPQLTRFSHLPWLTHGLCQLPVHKHIFSASSLWVIPTLSLCLPSFQLTITGNNISRFSPLPYKCRSITFSQLVVLTSISACPSSVFLLSLPLLSLSFVSNAIYSSLFTVESL